MTEDQERKKPFDVEKFMTAGFRKATIDFGTTNPTDLPLDDPRVKTLYGFYDSWIRVEQIKANRVGTIEADIEMTLKVTPFLVDAGFTDPVYVDEVANDWLVQDLARAKAAGLDEFAARIQAKIDQLLSLLPTPKEQ